MIIKNFWGEKLNKYLTIILFAFMATAVSAQTPDSLKNIWEPSLTVGLGLNQAAFSNWVKGGENSIAWSVFEDFKLNLDGDVWSFKNQIKAAYGRAKIGSETYKTTDNDFYMEDVASYNVGWAVSPFFSNSIRTQVAKGYDYKKPDAPNISDVFDPGYVTQTIGFTYDKYKPVITRLGIGFQEVFTNKFTQYTDDPATLNEVEKFKFETGIESVTDLKYTLDTNIKYGFKLRLFSRFESLDVWDVRWDNVITAKVNSWLSVNFTYLLIYEKDQSPYTQTKQTLQIGIVYTLL